MVMIIFKSLIISAGTRSDRAGSGSRINSRECTVLTRAEGGGTRSRRSDPTRSIHVLLVPVLLKLLNVALRQPELTNRLQKISFKSASQTKLALLLLLQELADLAFQRASAANHQ